jgi:hypothetical protein
MSIGIRIGWVVLHLRMCPAPHNFRNRFSRIPSQPLHKKPPVENMTWECIRIDSQSLHPHILQGFRNYRSQALRCSRRRRFRIPRQADCTFWACIPMNHIGWAPRLHILARHYKNHNSTFRDNHRAAFRSWLQAESRFSVSSRIRSSRPHRHMSRVASIRRNR